ACPGDGEGVEPVIRLVVVLPLLLASPLASAVGGDLNYVMEESNLEKRSERAWKNAHIAMDEARDAYRDGNYEAMDRAVAEIRESIDLCKKSLDDSGKDARRNSKYFKRAEQGM